MPKETSKTFNSFCDPTETTASCSSWSEQDLQIWDASAWSDFSVQKPIRTEPVGSFTHIFKARLHEDYLDGPLTACAYTIKCFKRSISAVDMEAKARELESESQLIARLAHPNIIRVHGVSSAFYQQADSMNYFVLYEALEETLEDLLNSWMKHPVLSRKAPLFRNRSNVVRKKIKSSLHRRIQLVAMGLCKAVSFAHLQGIVLRNLRPNTIGFDTCGRVKLYDFSEAVFIGSSQSKDEIAGALLTMQASSVDTKMTKSSDPSARCADDVFDFGVILWQVASLRNPSGDSKKFGVLSKGMSNPSSSPYLGKRPTFLEVPSKRVQTLIEACWDSNPDARPTFARLYTMLLDRYGPQISDSRH